MKKPDLTIVHQPTPSADSNASVEKRVDDLTIDGPLPDDDGPKKPRGGGVAQPVPLPPEDQWVKALAAFTQAAEDMSRAARHVQFIRYPLESLARNITTMTDDIGGTRMELSQLRQNLVPPIAVEAMTKEPVRVKHVGTLPVSVKPPGLSRRMKSVAWYVVRVIIGALAVSGAMHALGWFLPDAVSIWSLLR